MPKIFVILIILAVGYFIGVKWPQIGTRFLPV